MPKHIRVNLEDWIRMMFCVKHLMKLHPEYNDMIMTFYAKMYDKYPYNENDPFDFKESRPRTTIERSLDELVELNNKEKKTTKKEFNDNLNLLLVDLGLKLPSWDDNKEEGKDNGKT